MKTFFILILLPVAVLAHGQSRLPNSFNKIGTFNVKKLHKNDTILILCDTVYLVNRPLFLVYSDLYSKQKTIQQTLNSSSEIFQNHINDQERQYDKLNLEFNRTLAEFKKYQANSIQNIDSLQVNLTNAEENLATAKKENDTLKQQIGKALQKSNSGKYYFGLAGLSIGLIVGFILR